MSIAIGARQDMWVPILKIKGVPDIRCLSRSGGAADSEETRIRPAGGLAEISLGGRRTLENITVAVSLSQVGPAIWRALRAKVGRATPAAVYTVPLDADGVAFGAEQQVGTGTLKSVGGIDTDANGSDSSSFKVEVTIVDEA